MNVNAVRISLKFQTVNVYVEFLFCKRMPVVFVLVALEEDAENGECFVEIDDAPFFFSVACVRKVEKTAFCSELMFDAFFNDFVHERAEPNVFPGDRLFFRHLITILVFVFLLAFGEEQKR